MSQTIVEVPFDLLKHVIKDQKFKVIEEQSGCKFVLTRTPKNGGIKIVARDPQQYRLGRELLITLINEFGERHGIQNGVVNLMELTEPINSSPALPSASTPVSWNYVRSVRQSAPRGMQPYEQQPIRLLRGMLPRNSGDQTLRGRPPACGIQQNGVFARPLTNQQFSGSQSAPLLRPSVLQNAFSRMSLADNQPCQPFQFSAMGQKPKLNFQNTPPTLQLPQATSAGISTQASSEPQVQRATPKMLVEISCDIANSISMKFEELTSISKCEFKIVEQHDKTFVEIKHQNVINVCSGRKHLYAHIVSMKQPSHNPSTSHTHKVAEPKKELQSYSKCPFAVRASSSSLPDWDVAHFTAPTKSPVSLPEVVRDFYKEDPEVAAMTAAEVALFRKENMDISVKFLSGQKKPIPNPVTTFSQAFKEFPDILSQLTRFTTPSPIQSQAWPILLKGHDMIGIAQTGTGKTLAFLLPAFVHITNQILPRDQRKGPTCLVLSPTRELAQQIFEEACKYTYKGIRCACFYGGARRSLQMRQMMGGMCEVIIGTPGRLIELSEDEVLDFRYVTYLVLDEADRMLDMGFGPQVRRILRTIRKNRQTVMTSATWPVEVRQLAQEFLMDPIQISVGTLDATAAMSVAQKIRLVEKRQKFQLALSLLKSFSPTDKVIVFCATKVMTDNIGRRLQESGLKAVIIHGDREQAQRELALRQLKSGEARVLVATDVASRGLDVPDITAVVNFDFPRTIDEYVHRIGRTGRAGRTGTSYSMLTMEDKRLAPELVDVLGKSDQPIPQWLYDMTDGRRRP